MDASVRLLLTFPPVSMKMKYAFGTIAGISSLILVPILATAAPSAGTVPSERGSRERPVPSQTCVQALADREALELTDMDANADARRSAMQTHHEALVAAAAIEDEAQRQAAVEQANETFRTAMQDLMQSQSDAMKTVMETVRTECGGFGGHGKGIGLGMGGGFGGGRMMGEFRGEGMHDGMRRGWQQSSEDAE